MGGTLNEDNPKQDCIFTFPGSLQPIDLDRYFQPIRILPFDRRLVVILLVRVPVQI